MIDSLTKLKQILVIDDNQAWLNSLQLTGLQVLNCHNLSLWGIENKIDLLKPSLNVIVINSNILLGFPVQRLDFLGLKIGKDILEQKYPDQRFVFLSFHFFEVYSQNIFCYTDFLTFINNATNGRE